MHLPCGIYHRLVFVEITVSIVARPSRWTIMPPSMYRYSNHRADPGEPCWELLADFVGKRPGRARQPVSVPAVI
jgi:hypothetical protein